MGLPHKRIPWEESNRSSKGETSKLMRKSIEKRVYRIGYVRKNIQLRNKTRGNAKSAKRMR